MDVNEYFLKYYFPFYTRASPYFVGMFLGWIFYETKKPQYHFSMSEKNRRICAVIGWIVAAAIALAVLYGLIPYMQITNKDELPSAISITYGSLHRFAWGISIAWVIFACVTGYGGFTEFLL